MSKKRAGVPNKGSREFARLNNRGVGVKNKTKPISVMLPSDLDTWVRSLPNRSERIRQAIRKEYELEKSAEADQDSENL